MNLPVETQILTTRIGESPQSATNPLARMAQNSAEWSLRASMLQLKSRQSGRESSPQTTQTNLQNSRWIFGGAYFPHRAHRLSPTRF
jgi:hypothetical protein